MSLSVYLTQERSETECHQCHGTGKYTPEPDEVYYSNITHNLGQMASMAGIYEHLWRPEELQITFAHQLIQPLEKGLAVLKSDPDFFKQFDAPNGWGVYDNLVTFVRQYLQACKDNPTASISICR